MCFLAGVQAWIAPEPPTDPVALPQTPQSSGGHTVKWRDGIALVK